MFSIILLYGHHSFSVESQVLVLENISKLVAKQRGITNLCAGGKAATAGCRVKLTELLTFMKADVLPQQLGIGLICALCTIQLKRSNLSG